MTTQRDKDFKIGCTKSYELHGLSDEYGDYANGWADGAEHARKELFTRLLSETRTKGEELYLEELAKEYGL